MPKWFKVWPFVLVTTAIFWLSVIKAPSLKFSEHWFWDNIDKIGHALAYAALCFTGINAFKNISEKKQLHTKTRLVIAGCCFLYGLSIEILQHFLPHRSFDPFDMLANAVGITLGAVIFARLYPQGFVS